MLKLNSVSKSFGDKKVLDDLSVTFNNGITGIAGSNGCGKTTALKIMTGLLAPDNGTIELDSENIDAQSSSWRAQIGYLPQTIGLYNRMTVYDFLDYMLALSAVNDKKTKTERIEYFTNELNLANYLKVPCGNLSGGVKQRVAIAQALIHDPKIVFLDEPTNNLDVEERERFHNFLNKIKHDKIILYVGHILNELGVVSSHLTFFKNGKLAFDGAPYELLHQSQYAVKQVLIDGYNLPAQIKPKDVLRKIEENGKLRIIYKAGLNAPEGESVEPQFEDAYKILTRD